MAAESVHALAQQLCLAALTPQERLWAMKNLHSDNPLAHREFVMFGLAAIAVLAILLVIVHYGQRWRELRTSKKWFSQFSTRNGLNHKEEVLLKKIVEKAGLGQIDAIFTMPSAFDKGLNELLKSKEPLLSESSLQTEIKLLRQKLGYDFQNAFGLTRRSQTTSRHIPPGKEITLTRRKDKQSEPVSGLIISNSEFEFQIKLSSELQSQAGEVWILQCNYGPSLWEFEIQLARIEGDTFVFGHSEDVRFISRRRFVRVPVNARAFVARFNFEIGSEAVLPVFEEGCLKQLAGPGLLIETAIEFAVGQRVLAIIELPDHKFIEEVGEVKHVRKIEKGYSIAVELVNISDAGVDKLIRATNMALVASVKPEPALV